VPERRPIAAENCIPAVVLLRFFPDSVYDHPLGVRPGIGANFFEAGVTQRTCTRHAVAITVALDVKR
jgi:hypothetical protein